MTRYDIAKFYGYNSPEEYDEAQRRLHENFVESKERQKPYDEKEPVKIRPVNQWISVKDRLPENCIEVLVYDTDCGIEIGWYDKEIGDFAADFISPLDAVTHWQPLPEPPKDGERNG